ncbi:hypothetical protein V6N13_073855 [Hibiscus sabdariffa]
MKNKEEAGRAIERLHGFHLYGSKLLVKVANKNSEWMGSTKARFYTGRDKQCGRRVEDSLGDVRVVERTSPKPVNTKSFIGHIENEELWQLRKCLVGVMESVCSVRSIHDRLVKWGLGEINMQRLGARAYFLMILDEDLTEMLEDVNWSYLREIFSEVMPWSDKLNFFERASWIEIRGLPLLCWNMTSLKRIAECWGKF